MKSMEELLVLRGEAFEEVRRLQMRIAVIDATLTTDPRYIEILQEWNGDVDAAFPGVLVLGEQDPHATSN